MSYSTHAIDDSQTIRGIASAAITAPAMKAVKFSSGKLALATAGDAAIGIVLADAEDVAADGALHVQIKDICYWLAGGTVAAGDQLKSDANGKCVAAGAGDVVNAIALEAGTSGNPCKVLIQHTTVPATPASLALGLNDLTDVDLTTAPTNNQILKYVSADSKFKPANDATA